jgi:hypothetical protein
MFFQLHQGLMAVPDKFRIYLETVKGLNGCLTVGKNIDVPTVLVLFCILHYNALMMYISACNTVVWTPELKLCKLLEPHLYTQGLVPLLVLDPSIYQTRPDPL